MNQRRPFAFASFFTLAVCLFLLAAFSLAEEPGLSRLPGSLNRAKDDHWSFQELGRPLLPKPNNPNWASNAIDYFILAKCDQQGIRPSAPANRQVLIRRLFLDVLGLPPSPAQVNRFVNDSRDDAYERLVDELLASQHYGQKRGQHWLDLARFAETDGFEHDKVRKEAWRYRDWVIAALNEDMPYDQFVRWQLAGDEMTDVVRAKTATAFCLSGPDMPDINSQEERRQNVLNEITGTVSATLLGLQMGCAQCHDHKYDPISQKDFYSLRAIFEPAIHVKKNQSLSWLDENKGDLPTSYLMIRGDWQRRGPVVQPQVPEVLSMHREFRVVKHPTSSGRRLAFANWLANPDNPLTARVIANRLWQYHFGTGLVETPSDFGLMGELPSHPKLLDYLATELVARDWSLKAISRLILTSSTYRQIGLKSGETEVDPRLLAHFPRNRLSGEIIRDAMLSSSNSLNTNMGGVGVRPPIPEEMKRTLLKNQWVVSENDADHFRRSIYVFARRNLRYPIFEVFDRPDGNLSCPRRNRSTTAPQSLHLLNSELTRDLSRRLAGDVLKSKQDSSEAIIEIFRRLLVRSPSQEELSIMTEFVKQQAEGLRQQNKTQLATPIPNENSLDPFTGTALTYLCLALFNTNEFIYVD